MLNARELTRRELLAGIPALSAALAIGCQKSTNPRSFVRLAHLTDPHVYGAKKAEQGFVRALEDAQKRGAELLVHGGDSIFDALAVERSEANAQWKVFHRLLDGHCSIPSLAVIGNHDIVGWSTQERKAESKQETLDNLKLAQPYYSQRFGAWKIVVLDSVSWAPERPSGYLASCGEDQLGWLDQELSSTTEPVCVISHIPILAACPFLDGPNERSGNWVVPGEWMHLDARALKDIFLRHRHVKLCLSGHSHLVDHLQYLGVSYYSSGAVCGGYWKGSCQDFSPAYALVDLYADATFEYQLISYQDSGETR